MNRRTMLAALGTSGLAAISATAQADEKSGAKKLSGPPKLSVADLQKVLFQEDVNPTQVYGSELEFTGKILSIGKGVDGSTVPFVQIEGWEKRSDLYGKVYVHNVIPDQMGTVGDCAKIRGLIVAHGYGTLFLWCYRWNRGEA